MKYLLFLIIGYVLLGFSCADGQWKRMSGLDTNYVSAIVAIGDTLFASTAGSWPGDGIFRSTDNGSTWDRISISMEVDFARCLLVKGDTLFTTAYNSDLLRSTDKGIHWESMGTRDKGIGLSSIISIGNTLFGVGYRIPRSTDNGITWSLTSDPFNGGLGGYIYNLASLGNILFITTGHGIFRSSNFGDSWTRCDDSTLGDDRIEPIGIKDTNIFIANIKGFFLSQDTGKTWRMINSNSYNKFAFTDDLYFAGSGELTYLGASAQLDNSTDGGTTWIFNDGLPDVYVSALFIHNGYIIAAMGGAGIWRRKLSEYSSVASSPVNRSTIQNYPNPFVSNTTITFTLASSSEVSVSIIDALGNQIALIPSKYYDAGSQHIQWDASRYPSGVYTCRIMADGISEVRKMVLMK